MSYDVWLEWNGEGITEGRNYTSNVGPMLRMAWDGGGMADLDGKTAVEVSRLLDFAIDAMQSDPDRFDALNPENGWGNRATCVQWLTELRGDCERFPEARVKVWA